MKGGTRGYTKGRGIVKKKMDWRKLLAKSFEIIHKESISQTYSEKGYQILVFKEKYSKEIIT